MARMMHRSSGRNNFNYVEPNKSKAPSLLQQQISPEQLRTTQQQISPEQLRTIQQQTQEAIKAVVDTDHSNDKNVKNPK
ncbi:unnamed protein product [Rotaria socialis]|uniref:Uncharacterized protein n=1 Tax=Rotaria socialis TaxID=392032 RepID=A0A820MYX5_9BILA|nr:unnamed protein product [Rotaria socialis]